jgi:hypothetical protein
MNKFTYRRHKAVACTTDPCIRGIFSWRESRAAAELLQMQATQLLKKEFVTSKHLRASYFKMVPLRDFAVLGGNSSSRISR